MAQLILDDGSVIDVDQKVLLVMAMNALQCLGDRLDLDDFYRDDGTFDLLKKQDWLKGYDQLDQLVRLLSPEIEIPVLKTVDSDLND